MRRRVHVTAGAAVGILAVLAMGACSGGSSGGASGGGGRDQAGGSAVFDQSAHGGAALPIPQGRVSNSAAGAPQKSGQAARALPLDDGTYKIRTAQMTVAVKGAANVAVQADQAISIAERAGGEVDSDDRTSGKDATAALQLRVPPDALQPTLTALGRLGVEKARTLSTTDVTQRVADVDSRVASARQSIARLRTLYAHARKIADVIAIEGELNSREADLESLEAQQRSLARQTSLATINLSLVTAAKRVPPPPPAKPEHKRGGFLGGLQRGWDGFAAAAVWVAAAIGTLLPFLVLLLVVGLGVRFVRPRLPHRHPSPTPSE